MRYFVFGLTMRIASWNVNSAKARLEHITNWLAGDNTDVLMMQEIKSQDENFPRDAFKDLGWHITVHGQKSYNGVAIASRFPIEDVMNGLPGDDEDEQELDEETNDLGEVKDQINEPETNKQTTEIETSSHSPHAPDN